MLRQLWLHKFDLKPSNFSIQQFQYLLKFQPINEGSSDDKVIAAISEWFLALFIGLYLGTFSVEFSRMGARSRVSVDHRAYTVFNTHTDEDD